MTVFTPPAERDFPTPSGLTLANVTKLCSDALRGSNTIKECMSRAGLTFISEIEMCVEDIKVIMATGRSEAVVLMLFDLHYANLRDVCPQSLSQKFYTRVR